MDARSQGSLNILYDTLMTSGSGLETATLQTFPSKIKFNMLHINNYRILIEELNCEENLLIATQLFIVLKQVACTSRQVQIFDLINKI